MSFICSSDKHDTNDIFESQFMKEKDYLEQIIPYIFHKYKNIKKIFIDDRVKATDHYKLKQTKNYQYAISLRKDYYCRIGSTILYELTKKNISIDNILIQNLLSVIAQCNCYLDHITIKRNESDLLEKNITENHYTINKIDEIWSANKLASDYLKIQLTIFFDKLINIHESLQRDYYFIVNELEEVTGIIKSVPYHLRDGNIYIKHDKLSNINIASTAFYKDVINDIVLDDKFKFEYYPHEHPFVEIIHQETTEDSTSNDQNVY